ncbi:helix-turn-helix domain-containing protein [Streptomyces sp. NPDC020965]|uniref:helix-turn-helix domain-containing protein n=1 Tax=Streptomyces sp. NPDC020965 TaxID=3365105 RepID=UPI00378A6808
MLTETVFTSDDLPASDRLDWWRERMARTHAPMELISEHAADFRVTQRVLDLGAVRMWPVAYRPMVFLRTPKLIRASDPELCHLSIPLNGETRSLHGDHETVGGPFTIIPDHSSAPSETRSLVHGSLLHRGIGVEIPRAALPLPDDAILRMTGRTLSGRTGIGGLLIGLLTSLAADSSPYRPSDGPRLGVTVIDLVAALFAHTLDAEAAVPPETRRHVLLLRVKSYIRRHLADPGLTPGRIAQAHHISVRYLHRLFQDEETTVTSLIRRLRLENTRTDLADPAFRSAPIHVIAARWGFPRAADFSRGFRSAYGAPPSEYRHQALRTAGEAGP